MIDEKFFDELRREQDRGREQARYVQQAHVRGAVQARKRQVSMLRRGIYALAGGVALAAAAALAWQSLHDAPAFFVGDGATAGSVGAFIAAPNAHELPLRFADGTRVALAAGTSARVASLDQHGAHIVLEKGRVSASVVHRPGSHWQVDVGPYQVAVVGTRFDVSWDAGTRVLELQLTQGSVLVSGGFLRDAMPVRAGQTLRAFSDSGRIELLDSAEPNKAQNGVTAPSAVTPETAPPPSEEPSGTVPAPNGSAPAAAAAAPVTPSVAAAPTWQTLASAGKYRDALAAAEKLGFDAECRRASGSELLTLADAARLAGSAQRAEQAYSAARSKLPGGGRATYGLGLIAFDHRGDFTTAARWFEQYLRDQPGGSLRAEASGRLLEALQRSGQREKARNVAERYLAQYPRGPQAALAQQLLR